MLKQSKHSLLAATALLFGAQAHATGTQAEWWLVVDDQNAATVNFVDLASLQRSETAVSVTVMALNSGGNRELRTLTTDCERPLAGPGNGSVKAFICGDADYRSSNGLVLGAVTPDEMAAILFAGHPGHVAQRADGTA